MSDPYGVIDLASLRTSQAASTGSPSRGEVTVTEANLEQVIAGSARTATLMVVTSARIPDGDAFLEDLRRAVDETDGVIALAVVDADTQARVAGALRVQSLPTVVLLLQGQVQPLFEGVVPGDQLRGMLAQIVDLARQQGLAGPAGEEKPEEPLSPLQQEAFDALERGDVDAAIAAYERALTENPSDAEARAQLASVTLMKRTQDADLQAARTAAADRPEDLDAQMLVADLDVLGGHVDDAFARLLERLRGADEDTRTRVRDRLLELFEVVGPTDPRVVAARKRMANLLF